MRQRVEDRGLQLLRSARNFSLLGLFRGTALAMAAPTLFHGDLQQSRRHAAPRDADAARELAAHVDRRDGERGIRIVETVPGSGHIAKCPIGDPLVPGS